MHGLSAEVGMTGSVPNCPRSPLAREIVAAAATQVTLKTRECHCVGTSDDATVLMREVMSHGGIATYCVIGAGLFCPHHHTTFDFNEGALLPAVETLEGIIRNSDSLLPAGRAE